jgi:hypothetical protein
MGMVQLTYEELAQRLGLSPRAARMRAKRRKGWTITTGNDGRARISIDESELAAESARSPSAERARVPARAVHVPVHEGNEQSATDAEARVEQWRSAAEDRAVALARAEGENRVLREALARERELVEEHRARADRLEAELRQLQEEARRPWWRKLLS